MLQARSQKELGFFIFHVSAPHFRVLLYELQEVLMIVGSSTDGLSRHLQPCSGSLDVPVDALSYVAHSSMRSAFAQLPERGNMLLRVNLRLTTAFLSGK
jgi:hypothetical protein